MSGIRFRLDIHGCPWAPALRVPEVPRRSHRRRCREAVARARRSSRSLRLLVAIEPADSSRRISDLEGQRFTSSDSLDVRKAQRIDHFRRKNLARADWSPTSKSLGLGGASVSNCPRLSAIDFVRDGCDPTLSLTHSGSEKLSGEELFITPWELLPTLRESRRGRNAAGRLRSGKAWRSISRGVRKRCPGRNWC